MPIVKKICEHDCLSRNLMGVYLCVFVVKYPNYNMIMMSTHSGLMVCDDQKEEYKMSKGKKITFQCAEPFARHY